MYIYKSRFGIWFLSIALLLFSSCAARRLQFGRNLKSVNIPLFIEMPQNVVVFDDLSGFLYEALWSRCKSVGYPLKLYNQQGSFRLVTKIVDMDRESQLLSFDVVVHGFRVRLTVYCELYTSDGTLIDSTTFRFYDWFSRSKSPLLYGYYYREQYRALFSRWVGQIDYFIRAAIESYLAKEKK